MSLKKFVKEMNGERVEGELIKTILISLVTSLIVIIGLYYLQFQHIESFVPKYGYFLFFSVLSYALILPTVRQVQAHKYFSCMSGMMIGMTIGMIAGFLIGFYVGATNGMFWGGFFGVLIGLIFGIWNGVCCGVMGFLEGAMAGLMGGLMGAMSSVMMINENLKAASAIVFLICGVILFGLSYMIYEETKGKEREYFSSNMFTAIISFILTVITALMIVYGPRSALFQ
jgi:hypothetical protein